MKTPLTVPSVCLVGQVIIGVFFLSLSVSLSLFMIAVFVIIFTLKKNPFRIVLFFRWGGGGGHSLSPAFLLWSTRMALRSPAVCSAQSHHAYRQHACWKYSPQSWLPGEGNTWLLLTCISHCLDSQLPSLPFLTGAGPRLGRWGGETAAFA